MSKLVFIFSTISLVIFAVALFPITSTKAGNHGANKPVNKLNGGGQIVKDGNVISFGGNVQEAENGNLRGQFQVNFHNVGNDDIDGGRFHSTNVEEATWFDGTGDCDAAMNATFEGTFNGDPGHQLIFRAGDNEDTVRFQLSGPNSYDSNADYENESNCVGTARAELDQGGLKINLAD